MPKVPETHGANCQNDLLRTYVAVEGEQRRYSCRTLTDENLSNILELCGFFPEDDTFITQVARTKPTTIVISLEPRKIHEKNGAT
jgi:hypothetical protein